MVLVFRLVYACAAFFSMAAAALITASFFIADRAPQSTKVLGISLVASTVFVGVGLVLLGIRRHFTAITAAVRGEDGGPPRGLVEHADRLVAHLLAGGVLVCALLAVLTSVILERIGQGFAVFG